MRWFTFSLLIGTLIFIGCGGGGYNIRVDHAQSLIEQKDYQTARDDLELILKHYPDGSRTHYLIGMIHYYHQQYYDALTLFDLAERFGFETTPQYTVSKGIAQYHTGNLEAARRTFEEAGTVHDQNVAAKYIGLIAYSTGDFAAALPELESAAKQLFNDATVHAYLARTRARLGDIPGATEPALTAVELSPDDDDMRMFAGDILLLVDRYAEAIELYDDITTDSHHYSDALYHMSEAYLRRGEYHTASTLLREYILYHPDDRSAMLNFGTSLMESDELREASEVFATLLETDGNDISAMYNLGLAYRELGASEQSLDHLGRVTYDNPDNATFRYAYGTTLAETGDTDAAREQMEIVVRLAPGHADARQWLDRNLEPSESVPESIRK
jgi:tetratricopeptide (TPR) repeat protein